MQISLGYFVPVPSQESATETATDLSTMNLNGAANGGYDRPQPSFVFSTTGMNELGPQTGRSLVFFEKYEPFVNRWLT